MEFLNFDRSEAIPLAERMRPSTLDQVVGQRHLVAPQSTFRRALDNKVLRSCLFWGPPGVGKTTLAQIIAKSAERPFYALSAIQAGVKDIREIVQKPHGLFPPVVFIDEIHRFNKSQQDALLPSVEQGKITLIGATTENPSFEVNAALLSRCQIYTLEPLTLADLVVIAERAFKEDSVLVQKKIEVDSYEMLYQYSGGDVRKWLNALEMVVLSQWDLPVVRVNHETIGAVLPSLVSRYDKQGEQHYDIISAFIKSIRGSDPDAALYWFGRMWLAGEEDVFIARRLLILAAEDIGLANPTAVIMAKNCLESVRMIGRPESRIILGQTIIYLATSPKSNSSYRAVDKAIAFAEKNLHAEVPLALRNAPTQWMKQIGYGKGYLYSHDYPGHFARQSFWPDQMEEQVFFQPAENPREQELAKILKNWWPTRYKKE